MNSPLIEDLNQPRTRHRSGERHHQPSDWIAGAWFISRRRISRIRVWNPDRWAPVKAHFSAAKDSGRSAGSASSARSGQQKSGGVFRRRRLFSAIL